MSTFQAVVALAGSTPIPGTLVLVPEQNLRSGIQDFGARYPDYTSLEVDVLRIASAIYACDLAFKRGEREQITRSIELHIPVVNHSVFQSVKQDLELLLLTLSHDNWTLNFVRTDGPPEPRRSWPKSPGATLLFSGGVDSFAGAIDLLSERGLDAVQLASHVTANPVVRQSQQDLAAYLASAFAGSLQRISVRTGARKKPPYDFPSDADREETQRTRSFTFLAIAALAARRTGHNELIVMAENGQMAIHIPLCAARVGAFSTHTAHPEFVVQAKAFFSTVLDFNFTVTNPYLYNTKAEVVSRIAGAHSQALNQSVSCWRGARVSSLNHCGECVPCLVRRIAFEFNSIVLPEYKRDLLSQDISALGENDEGKRNLVDIAEFSHAFLSMSDAELEMMFPDLINPEIDKTSAIAMYRRFSSEARAVLTKYPGVSMILPALPGGPPSPPSNRRPRVKGKGV